MKHINEEALGGCENLHTVILEGQTFLDLDCFTRRPRLTRISVLSGMSEYYKECQEEQVSAFHSIHIIQDIQE